MNNGINNESLSTNYLDIIKDKLYQLDDSILSEDVDIVCRYIVIRFLKTSTKISNMSQTEIAKELNNFIEEIQPFLLAFISVVNSAPLKPATSSLFGSLLEDSEA